MQLESGNIPIPAPKINWKKAVPEETKMRRKMLNLMKTVHAVARGKNRNTNDRRNSYTPPSPMSRGKMNLAAHLKDTTIVKSSVPKNIVLNKKKETEYVEFSEKKSEEKKKVGLLTFDLQ